MIVQSRACIDIHALSVRDLRSSNDLVDCLIHDIPHHIFLIIGVAPFNKAFCDVRSQYPSDPIAIVYRLETTPFTSRSLIACFFF